MNYYEILEVSQDASDEAIKKAFRKKALLHHPDLHKDQQEEQKTKFLEIKKAYEVLINPSARALYDLRLKTGTEEESLQDFWKYSSPERSRNKPFTPRKKPTKTRQQSAEEAKAAWEAEKAEARSTKIRSALREQKTRLARQIRLSEQLRGFWQSHSRVTWQDGALMFCCLCFFCCIWNSSKLKLKLKDS